jgi:hypothetical protein
MKIQSYKEGESIFGAPDRPFRLSFIRGHEQMSVLWGRQAIGTTPLCEGATQKDALRAARDYALATGCYLIEARKQDEPTRTLRILAELAEPDAGPLVRLREWIPHSLGGKEYRELTLVELREAAGTHSIEVDKQLVLNGADCALLLAKIKKSLSFRAGRTIRVVTKRSRLSSLAEY